MHAAPQPFPWEAAMGAGFGLLRLAPAEFWAATPREIAAAARALNPSPAAFARADYDALAARYPDGVTHG
ncbi:MAG: phage tail assembly chaperone [Hyphomicrobiales bacterium]|nr:phage tail assembly chaperone [Hyphomicrobiales bacterium]